MAAPKLGLSATFRIYWSGITNFFATRLFNIQCRTLERAVKRKRPTSI